MSHLLLLNFRTITGTIRAKSVSILQEFARMRAWYLDVYYKQIQEELFDVGGKKRWRRNY